jgi:hypothetical protein
VRALGRWQPAAAVLMLCDIAASFGQQYGCEKPNTCTSRVSQAARLPDRSIKAACSNGEDYRMMTLTGEAAGTVSEGLTFIARVGNCQDATD